MVSASYSKWPNILLLTFWLIASVIIAVCRFAISLSFLPILSIFMSVIQTKYIIHSLNKSSSFKSKSLSCRSRCLLTCATAPCVMGWPRPTFTFIAPPPAPANWLCCRNWPWLAVWGTMLLLWPPIIPWVGGILDGDMFIWVEKRTHESVEHGDSLSLWSAGRVESRNDQDVDEVVDRQTAASIKNRADWGGSALKRKKRGLSISGSDGLFTS